MAYSLDFIKRAVEYKDEGHTFEQLREAFNIPPNTYYDWAEKLASGYYDVKTKQVRKGKIDKEALKKAVKENPDAYLWELALLFSCSPVAIFYALRNLKITLKKRPLPIRKNQKRNGKSLRKN